jgi:hypothetical protein
MVSLAFVSATMFAAATAGSPSPEQVLRLQAVSPAGVRDGTAFVVHQEAAGGSTTAWLVTSARLFDRDGRRTARIVVAGQTVNVGPEDIATPYRNMRDVAVLRARITGAALSTLPVAFDEIHAGTLVLVSGLDADGRPVALALRAAFAATRAIRGDRVLAGLAGCQGAPVLVDGAVVGIVSDCSTTQMPEITPMTVARSFLRRTIPGFREQLTRHAGELDMTAREMRSY